MDRINFIDEQIQLTRNLTLKLFNELPEELWHKTPEVINSNIAWQAGHLIISQNYHCLSVVTGMNEKVLKEIPLRLYLTLYGMKTNPSEQNIEMPSPADLKRHLEFVNNIVHEELLKLKDEDLDCPLVPTKFPHPIAKTRYEALVWSFKHEMWHCGQISLINRILGYPTRWN